MSSRHEPKFNAVERASFAIVPETCPAIDRATDAAHNFYDEAIVLASLAGNRVEATPAIVMAMREAISRHLFVATQCVANAAKYEGTYPLRVALVRQLERNVGMLPQRSMHEHWMLYRPPCRITGPKATGATP